MAGEDALFQRFGKEFKRGDVLFKEGDVGKEMYVIQAGKVNITKKVRDTEKILATLGAGEFLGEMAILNNKPRSAGAVMAEYAPASVKLATVGFGQADKRAMGRGVALRLGLARPPAPDAADALALALCFLHRAPLAARVARALAAGAPA